VPQTTSEPTEQVRIPWNWTRASICRLRLCTHHPSFGCHQLYWL